MIGSGTFEGTAMFFFHRWSAPVRDALIAHAPSVAPDATMATIEANYRALIPQMSDPGLFAPLLRVFILNGAVYIAVYQALAPSGFTPAQAWTVCDAATRGFCAAFSKLEDAIVTDTMFSSVMAEYLRWEGSRTERTPIGEWVYEYVSGVEGQFDYGVDFERCALRELAAKAGTEAFAPYVCLGDIPISEAFSLGLHRTQTLAQGGQRCDFRFVRNGPTVVSRRLPVVE